MRDALLVFSAKVPCPAGARVLQICCSLVVSNGLDCLPIALLSGMMVSAALHAGQCRPASAAGGAAAGARRRRRRSAGAPALRYGDIAAAR